MSEADNNPPEPTPADAVIGGAVGWLFVIIGCATVALTALVPAYLDTLDVQEARAIEQAKAEILAEETQRYVDFHQALINNDPLLIERLAMTELRLKPTGTAMANRTPFDPVALVDAPDLATIDAALTRRPLMRSIENELSRPDLNRQAEIDVQIERPKQTQLLASVTGEYRPWVAGFGALLLLVGLWPRRAAA